ncbi:protein O-linked-mannose beta-1,2-N-acetylglucosaminyltransferase 1 isoform X1 [Procambarus clarkii]|uniref:protein O-linked-mannose beta-1,2-N-acetylglucosaminyltransferase 1 isoform X1 n=3 Tax=Procambarus clarkii TaxID=6728 RepID=UPI001E67473D|nr:protein O-linked-mannose beta-1,2-N-acetylglucosaminyltransferase 1-like isoform X1 [Procambarus clarkii]
MKRFSLASAFRHVGFMGITIFVGFGLYGIYEFFFGSLPVHTVEFFQANSTVPFPFQDHGERIVSQYMQIGEILPNCGLDYVCPHDHFPVHIYSGKSKDDMPKICVSGKYVIQRDINNGGRGMNMVVVDSHRMKPVNARRFDTYAMDSSEMELFLLREVREGDILIAMTFDEASRNLGAMAKSLLADLGSSQIQNLQFRGQWFMISQRGMKGFSPYEILKASKGGLWSPIDEHTCVPRQLKGRIIMPDPKVMQNDARSKFCEQHSYISDFCSVDQRNVPLKPAILTNRQLVGSAMFMTPIMVVAGESLSSLTLTLETILSQPGIQPRYVVVVYNPEVIKDVTQLCQLFGFNAKATSEKKYFRIMAVVFETAFALFPGSSYVTVIEEGLLLAPDFMAYSASVLPLLHDPTIIAISAWNANGFPNVSSRPDLVYRIEDFPGQAFTIRMATYIKELKPNMKECCNKRGWEGWLELGRWEREIVVPDVSRVLRRPVGTDLEPVTPLIHALFHRLRATNLEMTSPLSNADTLTAERYENHLVELLNSSHAHMIRLTKEAVNACALNESMKNLKLIFDDKQSVHVVPYKELDITGFGGMKILCRCFGLFYDDRSTPRGLHRGLLRFSMEGSEVIFLSNRNQHFVMPPFNATTLSLP